MGILVWDVTSKCNLRCSHCYNANKYFRGSVIDLTLGESREAIDFFNNNRFKHIHFLGGEPLFRKDFLDILKYGKEKGFSISFSTNGILLSRELAEKILEIGVSAIFISVDGYNAEKNDKIRGNGTFEIVKKNILDLHRVNENNKEHGTIVCVSHVIDNDDCENAFKMVDFCRECNVRYLSLTPLIKAGNASDNFKDININNSEQMLNSIEKVVEYAEHVNYRLHLQLDVRPIVVKYLNMAYSTSVNYVKNYTMCEVLKKTMYMTSNGDLHPCGLYDLDSGRALVKEGYFNSNVTVNINKINSLEEIYYNEYFRDFLKGHRSLRRDTYHTNCKSCIVKKDCLPCPYQFKDVQDIFDCSWAFKRLERLIEYYKNLSVVYKNPKGKYLPQFSALCSVFDKLHVGNSLYDNFLNQSTYNEYEYFSIIMELKNMYLIKMEVCHEVKG